MIRWMMTAHAVGLVTAAGATAAPAWTIGTNTVVVRSVEAARKVLATTAARTIVADLEAWKWTPADEQKDPGAAIALICDMAHAAKRRCIAAPAMDLFAGQAGYLAAPMIARAAPHVDGWEIQAQRYELWPADYASFTAAVARRVHELAPHATILAGLTTSDRIGTVTGEALYDAVQASQKHLGGYWLNIPGTSPECPTCGPANPAPAVWLLNKLAEVWPVQ